MMKQPPSPAVSQRSRRVVILGVPPVDALDVVGPAEVFYFANRLSQSSHPPYQVELMSTGDSLEMKSEAGLTFCAHTLLKDEHLNPAEIDTLIVVCGTRILDGIDASVTKWIKHQAEHVRRVCSICIGAFILAEAGVLDGRRATSHWFMSEQLAARYPAVTVDPDPIWIKDGNIYTSAGVSAGIDLALALVEEDVGTQHALMIARNLVLFLRRPGSQAQFSFALQSQQALSSELELLCLWINEHLDADLRVEALADKLSTSARTVIRLFQRELNTTPARYVEDVRLEAVCRAIELGATLTDRVAHKHGYASLDVLRKAFARRLGVTPKGYVLQATQRAQLQAHAAAAREAAMAMNRIHQQVSG